MKKMRKLTRRSYNRKLLVFGLSMFMAVAMISTGFAAWVMSSTEDASTNGGVTVGTITNEMMMIKIDNLDEEGNLNLTNPLSFDAPEGDDAGRVKASADTKGEHLTLPLSGYVTNAASLDTIVITYTLPEALKNAIDADYIKFTGVDAQAYDAATGVLTIEIDSDELSERAEVAGSKEFEYTLTFAWGDFFGGVNPATFYDSDSIKRVENDVETVLGGNVSGGINNEMMETEMLAFGEVLKAGLTEDDEGASYSGNIAIVVSLTTKTA